MSKPDISTLRAETGISQSYASMILSGARDPSRPLAIHILRRTGWKHPTIADLSADQIATLEAIEPYRPTPSRPAPEQSAAAAA